MLDEALEKENAELKEQVANLEDDVTRYKQAFEDAEKRIEKMQSQFDSIRDLAKDGMRI